MSFEFLRTIRLIDYSQTHVPETQHFAAGRVAREIMRWAPPVSLAATKGIAFAFFSSA